MPDDFAFCGRCGTRLSVTGPAAGERQVTCVFADVTGFTSLAERLEPEELHGVMRTAWDAVAEEVRVRGGMIEKYIGDALVAVFGAPLAHKDDPGRAVAAALAMLDALERVNAEIEQAAQRRLALRVGVNTGIVMAGAVGDRASEFGVLGDAVNVAARLQQSASPGEVLVGEPTYRATVEGFRYEAHPPVLAKGKSDPIVAWRLVAARPEPARPRTPLVGRAEVLAALWRELDTAAAGNGRAVALAGEPGVGVSRLLRELRLDARSSAFRIAHVACSPYDAGRPFAALEEIVRGVLGLDAGEPLERARRLVDDLLPGVDPEVRALVLEIVGHAALARPLAPGTRRRLIVRAAIDVLKRIAETQPVLVLVEDAHDMDSASRRALGILVPALAASRFALVATRRAGEALPWPRANGTDLRVDPLEAADARALLEAAAGRALDDAAAARAISLGSGSPAYLEELALRLVEGAHLDGTVAMLAVERIARLPREEQLVLRSAAVIGRVFDGALLRGAVGGDADTDGAVDRLEAAGILEPAGEGGRFRYGGLRDAVHRAIPARQRGELHGRVALAIERHDPDLARRRPDLLALHLAPSPYALRAFEYAMRAAERALELDDPDVAATHLRAALELAELAPGGAAERGGALARLAEVERLRGDDRAAVNAFDALLAMTAPEEAIGIRVRLGRLLAERGDAERAAEHLAHAERAVPVAPAVRAELALAKAHLAWRSAAADEAAAFAEQSADLAREAQDAALELDALDALDRFATGRPAARAPMLRRALERATAAGDLVRAADHCVRLAALESLPAAERDTFAREAGERYEHIADAAGRARALRALAAVRLDAGEIPAAEALLQDADALDPTSDAHLIARTKAALARVATAARDLATARARLAEAERAVPADCPRCATRVALAAAELALAEGDREGARERCVSAMENAVRTGLAKELATLRELAERIGAGPRTTLAG